MGKFLHSCEGEAICELTQSKVFILIIQDIHIHINSRFRSSTPRFSGPTKLKYSFILVHERSIFKY